jgi:hypothetical protein
MRGFQIFANLATAIVLPTCFFTRPTWHDRWLDMVIIGVNIFALLSKLDSIEDKLRP